MVQPVAVTEVVDPARYESQRPQFRSQVMAEKERRRVAVGPYFTFLFENHLTVLYQVQEMVRVERITDAAAIAHEVRTYNELLPPPGGLGASLLLEYEDPALRGRELRALLGLERHVWLELGELPRVSGAFDLRQMDEERVSAVQYVRFALGEPHRRLWLGLGHSGQIRLTVDHPRYAHSATLSRSVADALAEDLNLKG